MITPRRATGSSLRWHPSNWSVRAKLLILNLVLSLGPVFILACVGGLRLEEALAGGTGTMGQAVAAVGAMTLLAAVALSLVAASRITSPIRRLAEDIDRLALGDLSSTLDEEHMGASGPVLTGEGATSVDQERTAVIDRLNAERMQLASRIAASDLVVAAAAGLRSDAGVVVQLLKEHMASNRSFTGVFVLDADGRCIASTNSEMVGKMYSFRPYWKHSIKGELYTSRVAVSVDTRRPMIVYSAPIKHRGEVVGVLALRTDGSEVSELLFRGRTKGGSRDEIQRLRVSVAQTREYLRQLSIEADRVAAGDLTRNAPTRSQMDALGISFNGMIVGLRKLVGEVKVAAEELSGASEQLSGATSETGSAVQQVTGAMQGMAAGSQEVSRAAQTTNEAVGTLTQAIDAIARGAEEQSRQVEAATAAVTEMAAKVERVAKNADNLATAGERTKGSAEQGAKAVRETVSGMAGIKEVVLQAASRVEDLGRLGDRIGAVVETIDDIADQTNLLALNAAIEAARAGEHGRGFAVVADEVRKLAERAQRETKSIAELIKEIQGGTREAVVAMETGSAKVQEGSAKADQAREALEEILKAVGSMAAQVGDIAAAARDMASGSRSVVGAMESISAVVEENTASTQEMARQAALVTSSAESVAAVAEENSASTEEVSASAQEMAAQIEQMSAQAQELAATAERLRSLAARFTVDVASERSVARPEERRVLPLARRSAK